MALNAFHSVWTAPFFALRALQGAAENGAPFGMEDFDLLGLMLSALEWRRHNGPISLSTDEAGEAYFRSRGLLHLWNGGVSPLDSAVLGSIDPFLFWAGGKLAALRTRTAPVVMIDTDFIVWEPLEPLLRSRRLAVIHREALDPAVYPPPERFLLAPGGELDPRWDLSEPACNTALCFFGDQALLKDYTGHALRLMTHLRGGSDRVTGMVFAEQRLLAMIAKEHHIPVYALADMEALGPGRQRRFTHLWGYKDVLRREPRERWAFCLRCIARLLRDFPAEERTLRALPELEPYFKLSDSPASD